MFKGPLNTEIQVNLLRVKWVVLGTRLGCRYFSDDSVHVRSVQRTTFGTVDHQSMEQRPFS